MTERYSVNVLRECIDLQNEKANDYQNPNSTIKQADYYPSGCLTILEIIQAKVLRMRSVMEAMQNDPNYKPNFESLEDSAKDLINYAWQHYVQQSLAADLGVEVGPLIWNVGSLHVYAHHFHLVK